MCRVTSAMASVMATGASGGDFACIAGGERLSAPHFRDDMNRRRLSWWAAEVLAPYEAAL
ncbi:hypothetical protein RCAP_rcc02012 [Rhodobacter capsulatus SB 1003]|uniref:Uncharacterized protein n=1 Tax=Rhodobacter capsulatus (strain ATCC BAA-309 / NBRC 16581 / SB1003) TaxID=272942 RepID=D5AUW7_RHOCB|nr:hypothetical protein RCAP_rcc02012 [Rhodobacter capsulatus SB 1003]